MNPLLFLYLNLVRGPQIAAERQRKEAEAAQAAGPVPAPAPVKPKEVVLASCKKCDKQVDEAELRANFDSLCVACASDPMSMLSPVFIFQILLILFALAVFVYRSL
ncbi:hypothetical protein SDRG_13473 [Saprolegnia diclina VS20]|uniref:Uncharacterized protein n=1 Tax=Saprolegnia diclina (strain VS20) TaxID=1156394 RepID=T0Q2J9_SAPDV|nr:hypothetical protein SDRG_13473 [Saprolegnia diclina VS20]EQC28791.1 hypothetical protein SDRG_13473 [Saprolegnia diclina VS20]|eukprot:XP_008617786.1 hypothetical protein SDRG_13473 [Saprolegnia diclina VS20]